MHSGASGEAAAAGYARLDGSAAGERPWATLMFSTSWRFLREQI